MRSRHLSRSLVLPLTAALLVVLRPAPASAGMLDVTASAPISVLEGHMPDVQVTFTVMNNTGVDLLLDFALAKITPNDPDDQAFFSGAGGGNGLVDAPISIANGATGKFIYSIQTPADPGVPEDGDVGLNRVDFSLEMSPLAPGVLPPPQHLSSKNNFLLLADLSPLGTTPDPAVLANLSPPNFIAPPLGTTLYAGGVMGNPYPATTSVSVVDLPEPSSLAACAIGALALLGFARRRRLRKSA